jgi:hypothetical protein
MHSTHKLVDKPNDLCKSQLEQTGLAGPVQAQPASTLGGKSLRVTDISESIVRCPDIV